MGKLALAKPRFELKKDEVSREQMRGFIIAMVIITMMMMACILNVSFADSDYASTIRDLIEKMVSIIGTIFQAVGAVLTVYSVGQLFLHLKMKTLFQVKSFNDDGCRRCIDCSSWRYRDTWPG